MSKLDQLREDLREQGYLAGPDPFPTGAFHVLILGSRSKGLDLDELSRKLAETLGIANAPIPNDPRYPNLYRFVAYRAETSAKVYDETLDRWVEIPFLVEEIELYLDDIDLAVVNPQVVTTDPDKVDDLIEESERFMEGGDDLTPIIFPDHTELDAGTWVFLRAHVCGREPLRPWTIKGLLEEEGYECLAPDEGLAGVFFPSELVKDEEWSIVLFRPGVGNTGVTPARVQREVFDRFGTCSDGIPAVSAGFYTTEKLRNSQTLIDTAHSVQSGAVGGGGALGGIWNTVVDALSAVPYVFWGIVGLIGAYGAWEGYKFVRDEWERRKDPGRITEKLDE